MLLDNRELSITPIPESINDEDGSADQIESSKSQVKIFLIRQQTRYDFVFDEIVNQIKF